MSPGGDAFSYNESCATGPKLTNCHYLCTAMDYADIASRIVYEDNHLLVIDKKSGEIVQGDKTGDTPLSETLKAFIKERDNKPGNVFMGVPHRLDRPVCGLCVFAKTSKALERLNAMFRDGEVHKTYLALCCAAPAEPEGLLEDWMERNEKLNKSFITRKPGPKAKLAKLRYRHVGDTDRYHLILPTDKIDDWIHPNNRPEDFLQYAVTDLITEKVHEKAIKKQNQLSFL